MHMKCTILYICRCIVRMYVLITVLNLRNVFIQPLAVMYNLVLHTYIRM